MAAKRITTAQGDTAVRLTEHTGNTWLIRTGNQTSVIELATDSRIQDFNFALDAGDWASHSRAWRLFANDIDSEMRASRTKPGWYVDLDVFSGTVGPFKSRMEAEEQIKLSAPNMGQYFPSAEKAEMLRLRKQWNELHDPIIENQDGENGTWGTPAWHALCSATENATDTMVEERLWASAVGPSTDDLSWTRWYEIALSTYETMLAEFTPEEEVAEEPETVQTTTLAAEDFRPGWRYWTVRPGFEDAWTIASVRIFEAGYQVQRDGKIFTPTLVEHTRRDGTTQTLELGEMVAIQGPWKTEA